jgi:hypothetical protein
LALAKPLATSPPIMLAAILPAPIKAMLISSIKNAAANEFGAIIADRTG